VSSGCSGVFEGAKGLKRARSVTSRNIPGWAKFGPGEQAQKTRTVKRHEDTNASQVNQKERAAQSREKEAGPAGGESWARVYGPALGGEAGAVLIGSLSAKGSRIDTGGRIGHRSRITARALMRLQPIELQHMPQGLRRPYA
jgi:hypothetical protein